MKCIVCFKTISLGHHFLQCNNCKLHIHKKCNKLNDIDYQFLKSCPTWFCIVCVDVLFPFSGITDNELKLMFCSGKILDINKLPSDLNIFPSFENNKLYKKFNDYFTSQALGSFATEDDDDESSNPINCKYFNIDDFCSSNFVSENSLSVFHMNISSLNAHFDELTAIMSLLNFNFDLIGLTETRLKKNVSVTIPIEIDGYCYEHTPTEASCGGALLYISNKLNYKPRNDLLIYKPFHLESVFLEVLFPKKSNLIVGCIYKHPCMTIDEFNDIISPVLDQISAENKTIILLGDFNIDLIKCCTDISSSEFFNLVSSHNLLPYITLPTRITDRSQTLIDNIFSNTTSTKIISGNLTSAISDHLPQFFIYPDFNKKFIPRKTQYFP